MLAKEVIKTIVTRTQDQGKGVKSFGGNRNKLKPLAESTVKKRKSFPRLSGKTTPSTSNLTMTGQLLRSLSYKLLGLGDILFVIVGDRNKKVAKHAQEARNFFTISKTELNNLAKFFSNLTRRK